MFERIKVDAMTVAQTLRDTAAERPDYVYENPEGLTGDGITTCFYVHPDGPGCLAGTALHKLGVPLSELAECEGQGASTVATSVLDIRGDAGNVVIMLAYAQRRQDGGDSWSVAVEKAEIHATEALV